MHNKIAVNIQNSFVSFSFSALYGAAAHESGILERNGGGHEEGSANQREQGEAAMHASNEQQSSPTSPEHRH